VFGLLPKLVERTGRSPKGSITAFYAVLVEADDPNEPISDAVRGLLDGHIWLSRKLASRGHYPAIDVLESLSRLMPDVAPPEQVRAAVAVRQLLSAYRDHEDLISIGAYRPGANPSVDAAIGMQNRISQYLRQPVEAKSTAEQAHAELIGLEQEAAERLSACESDSPPQAAPPRTDEG
jgi:flagellar biosynthesis/type III secretory pathway ATPase